MQVPQLTIPGGQENVASKVMSRMGEGDGGINSATIQLMKHKAEMKHKEREQGIKANEFALNLLSGVSSDEDLEIAKRQFSSRYPEYGEQVETLMPRYDPRGVDMIRNSLKNETQRMKMEELEWDRKYKREGYAPGTAIFRGEGPQEEQIGTVPTRPPAPSYEVFEDTDGNQAYIAKGDPIPQGYRKVSGGGVNVQVNTGDLTKPTTTKVQQEVIEGVRNVQSFQKTGELFENQFLEFMGKTRKRIAETMDKAGLSTDEQREYINKYAKWFRQAKSDFLSYRKWATGVAGGEKEMQEIATAFPDPVSNSPEQYRANLESIEETTKRVLQLNTDFLRLGIDMDQPLSIILEEAKKKGLDVAPPGGGGGSGGEVLRFDREGNLIEGEK